jgi:AcrR family transcriptional regulator
MGRRGYKPRTTQERLKTAAADVFTTRGYGVSGVDHIVEQAGTTRGAFYYYFASKADVARDVQEELWGSAARQSEAVFVHDDDFLTNVRRGLEAYLTALKDLGPERAFLREAFDDPTLAMVDGEGHKWGAHFIRQRLIEAMDAGHIPRQDVDGPTALLVEALQALTLAALDGGDVTDALAVIEELNKALLTGTIANVGEAVAPSRATNAPVMNHVTTFTRDEASYLDWTKAHPTGFVLNQMKVPSPGSLVLHRATCPSIRGKAANGGGWTSGSRKIASNDRDYLVEWILSQSGVKPTPCGMCGPFGPRPRGQRGLGHLRLLQNDDSAARQSPTPLNRP